VEWRSEVAATDRQARQALIAVALVFVFGVLIGLGIGLAL
jgi:hypothetical protein